MTSRKDEEFKSKDVPDVVVDTVSRKRYLKGHFLGKGGFAKCYELTDAETKEIFAGKVVPKSLLVKQHHREKLTQEIEIHRSVHHRHIVGFHSFFEDSDNVYIVLELCRRRSLMELHKRRRAVTEPECRYFVHQVALACHYLHKTRIIHRDLKLGNLFLNDDMEIKIGDFGLATRIDYVGERKKTLCGTPNYIAPEVLAKKGHSYEVDAWSLGCIVYTLLVGKPPFETSSLKDTYARISRNEYQLPGNLSNEACILIRRLLHPEPTRRPTMDQVLDDPFFTSGFLPAGLPTSCLTMAPRFDTLKLIDVSSRKPLTAINELQCVTAAPTSQNTVSCTAYKQSVDILQVVTATNGAGGLAQQAVDRPSSEPQQLLSADSYLTELFSLLSAVVAANLHQRPINIDEAEDPAAVPIYWISKWVDYSDKYGLGYQLCDNSVGVLFNDSTRLLLTSNGENMQYIERAGTEHFHTLKEFPESLTKKVTLLKYFRNYMQEHLLKAGANIAPREGEEMTRLPFLRTWFRTRSAIVLQLSNGILQINFFQDHTKVILCPLMGAVTYIDNSRDAHTYRLPLLEKHGCCTELASRLQYAKTMVERLLAAKSSSTSSSRPKSASAAVATLDVVA
jgi:polo-like kinase 1